MSDTPRTDATCKAIAAMLEPLRGGTRVTNAEMKAVQGTIEAIAKCSADLERDLARVTVEMEEWKARAEAAERDADGLRTIIRMAATDAKGHTHSRIQSRSGSMIAIDAAIAASGDRPEFSLAAQSRESVEARFYRYLRDEAGQYEGDEDGPMVCSGLGDLFDYLRGEECDEAIRAAIAAREGQVTDRADLERRERAYERGEHVDRQEGIDARRETMRYINRAVDGE